MVNSTALSRWTNRAISVGSLLIGMHQAPSKLTPITAYDVQSVLIDKHTAFLIKTGILDQTGNIIINQPKFDRLTGEAMHGAKSRQQAVTNVLASLGMAIDPIVDIPEASYDSPIGKMAYGEFAQNRVGYMRMTGMPLDGSRLGIAHGGLATGTIMRAPDGSFPTVNFTNIGRDIWDPNGNIASQFHVFAKTDDGKTVYAQTLCTRKPDLPQKLSNWKWGYPEEHGSYHALYPFSWWTYDDPKSPIRTAITAFSPIIPDNYHETSYPVVVYKIKLKNTSSKAVNASAMFSFQNLVGWRATNQNTWSAEAGRDINLPGIHPIFPASGQSPEDATAKMLITEFDKKSSGNSNYVLNNGQSIAIIMEGQSGNISAQGQIAIATKTDPRVSISYQNRFNTDGNGNELASFFSTGNLSNQNITRASAGEHIGGAIAVSANLGPNEEIEIPFVLAYDFPNQEFAKGNVSKKEYTKYYGDSGKNAAQIASDALAKHLEWESKVHAWQQERLNNPDMPSWAKGEMLNMLSLHQSDGIFWGNIPQRGYSLHVIGESNGADYKHAETRDVGVYDPSRAILWPDMHDNLMRHFAWSVTQANNKLTLFNEIDSKIPGLAKMTLPQKRKAITKYLIGDGASEENAKLLSETYLAPLKPYGATPHDIGAYDSDPALDLNSYTHQNPNVWSELSMVWILEAYRNYALNGDEELIEEIYPSIKASIAYAEKMDQDGDHIPDHRGIPDWTYDNWKTKGINSYTGGLWLATLEAGIKMAEMVGDQKSMEEWKKWLGIAKPSFEEKLWDEEKGYYRLSQERNDVFADHLWLLWPKITGLDEVVPHNHAVRSLRYVFENNVIGFGNGYMGAVNGTRDGRPIDGEQEREMWTGTSYALGAAMLAYGLKDEGWQTIFGTYNMTTNLGNTFGAWAEAYTIEPGIGNGPMFGLRARTYYRALSIWNIPLALDSK